MAMQRSAEACGAIRASPSSFTTRYPRHSASVATWVAAFHFYGFLDGRVAYPPIRPLGRHQATVVGATNRATARPLRVVFLLPRDYIPAENPRFPQVRDHAVTRRHASPNANGERVSDLLMRNQAIPKCVLQHGLQGPPKWRVFSLFSGNSADV